MKKLVLSVAFAMCAFSMFAQGNVIFTLKSGTVLNAPVYGPNPSRLTEAQVGNTSSGIPAGTQVYNGSLLSGNGYVAQLMSIRLTDGNGDWEAALTPAAPFGSGTEAGYVVPTIAILANVPKDAPGAWVRVFAWDNSSGLYPTWDLAAKGWNEGRIAAGATPGYKINDIGGDVNPPAVLVGLESFNIYYVPEPSIIAIAGLGAAAFAAIGTLRTGQTAVNHRSRGVRCLRGGSAIHSCIRK